MKYRFNGKDVKVEFKERKPRHSWSIDKVTKDGEIYCSKRIGYNLIFGEHYYDLNTKQWVSGMEPII